MEEKHLIPGATYRFDHVVGEADLASRLALAPEDQFPPVLATNRLVGLMEVAAARLMRRALPKGSLSVGVTVDVEHLAPTLEGETLSLRATFIGMDASLYVFEIEASDGGGLAGRARHTRAIVGLDQFMARAARRFA